MKTLLTVYRLPFTVRLLFTVNRERLTDNLWKTDNCEQLMGGVYE